jgi:hypothetical protein
MVYDMCDAALSSAKLLLSGVRSLVSKQLSRILTLCSNRSLLFNFRSLNKIL